MCPYFKYYQEFTWTDIGYIHGDSKVVATSLPLFAAYTDLSVADLPISSLNIKFKEGVAPTTVAMFMNELKVATGGMTFEIYN